MTAADVDRLYNAVEALRQDVHGYRADLNGRLRALETAEAERVGAEQTRGSFVRIVFGVAGMAAAVSATVAFILDRIP